MAICVFCPFPCILISSFPSQLAYKAVAFFAVLFQEAGAHVAAAGRAARGLWLEGPLLQHRLQSAHRSAGGVARGQLHQGGGERLGDGLRVHGGHHVRRLQSSKVGGPDQGVATQRRLSRVSARVHHCQRYRQQVRISPDHAFR